MPRLNLLEETRFEKLPVHVFGNRKEAARDVAARIAGLINARKAAGEKAILGLATGDTPKGIYAELIRLHREEGLEFKNVVTFNLDEYFPMEAAAPQSYARFMNDHLFDHIDIDRSNIHLPDGSLNQEDVAAYCVDYEKKINDLGGLDLQLLGIGRTGHIGFNEPGSAPNSGTRLVTLADMTRGDAAREFGSKHNVPQKAITMGIGTILKAKEIILMALGTQKASIVRKAVEGEVSDKIPATYLQLASSVDIVLDEEAASELTRISTPWLVKDCDWDAVLKKKAVIWLAELLSKPILKLTEDDYNNHGMSQLAIREGPVYSINIEVFTQIQHTITGWPGGRPDSSGSVRPERASPVKKRALIFSPHPDDDVISMGGTFIRLVDQGHDVHVAYQTSGNTAVWDDDVIRYLEFAIDLNNYIGGDTLHLKSFYHEIRAFLAQRRPNPLESTLIRHAKGFIRKSEALAGARFAGLADDHIHFTELPFYETGNTKKNSIGGRDILLTMNLLQTIKPHQVFAAGDFADPHGTHLICFNIIVQALRTLAETEEWVKDCWLWMYRGAWKEFPTHEIEMAVPLSPDEVLRKRFAIFKHQSQKDRPVFPGDDAREFWVRAEDRNRETAKAYDLLGLAEYQAIEAFVRYKF